MIPISGAENQQGREYMIPISGADNQQGQE